MNVRSKAVLIVLLALTPGNGVVFILNAGTTDEARTLLEDLPLSKAKILRFDLIPLLPLGLLLPDGAAASTRG